MSNHIYFMRHSQSQANAHMIIAGSDDSPLSPTGEQQADYAGDTLRQYFHFDLIACSPMRRALQTAQIVARHMGYAQDKILVLDDLRERDLGSIEGKDYSVAPHYNGNYEDAENAPGVEPIDDLFNRADRAVQTLRERPEHNILAIGHNGCGRMLKVVASGQKPLDMYSQPRTENAVVFRLI